MLTFKLPQRHVPRFLRRHQRTCTDMKCACPQDMCYSFLKHISIANDDLLSYDLLEALLMQGKSPLAAGDWYNNHLQIGLKFLKLPT